MIQIYKKKNRLFIFYTIKSFLKKKKRESVMFVRSPKHFKRGKQFLFYYCTTVHKILKCHKVNTNNLIYFKSQTLYNIFFSTFLKTTLMGQKLLKVSYKYTVNIKFKWLVFYF